MNFLYYLVVFIVFIIASNFICIKLSKAGVINGKEKNQSISDFIDKVIAENNENADVKNISNNNANNNNANNNNLNNSNTNNSNTNIHKHLVKYNILSFVAILVIFIIYFIINVLLFVFADVLMTLKYSYFWCSLFDIFTPTLLLFLGVLVISKIFNYKVKIPYFMYGILILSLCITVPVYIYDMKLLEKQLAMFSSGNFSLIELLEPGAPAINLFLQRFFTLCPAGCLGIYYFISSFKKIKQQ